MWRWRITDMKCRLVGARKFLEIAKLGTLFIPLQEIIDNIQDSVEIIQIIKPIYNFKSSG